jgi:hypothetical protein
MKNETHLHKCGFPYHDREGCGHVWSHASNLDATNAEYVASHTCPKCKRVMPMYGRHFWQFATEVKRAVRNIPEYAFEILAWQTNL